MQISKNNDETNNSVLSFTISNKEGLDTSILNSIRRVILNEVPTVAFNTETFEPTKENVNIISNNSVLHNEYLEHRIGLIPLCIDPKNYNYMDYLFVLEVKVDEEGTREVTTNDIEIYKKKDVSDERQQEIELSLKQLDLATYKQYYSRISDEEKRTILKPFIFEGDDHYITITKLKKENITGDDTEELRFMASPTVDIGKTNARYSHVSQVAYSYTIDDAKAAVERKARVLEENEDAGKLFDTLDIEKFYKKDKAGKSYSYDFKLESFGFLENKDYLKKAINILIKKLEDFMKNLEEEEYVIKDCLDINSAIEIIIPGEDDTLGNLLHKHIVNNFINEEDLDTSPVLFCSYTKPHPLTDEINIKIIVGTGDLIPIFQEAVTNLTGILKDIQTEIKKKI